MKKCYKCKNYKPIDEFNRNKTKKDGLSTECKDCVKAYNKAYQKANKDKVKKQRKTYRDNNKEKISLGKIQWYRDNIEKVKSNRRDYYEKNENKIKDYQKRYYKSNKKDIKKRIKAYRDANKDKRNSYEKSRRKKDPLYKLKSNLRSRVRALLKGSKSKRTQELLGCSWEQLFIHLNYNNLENPSHDHIIPLSWAETEDELYALIRWENIQGMELKDNVSKWNLYCDIKLADSVCKKHPRPEIIKKILRRQVKTKSKYVKKSD